MKLRIYQYGESILRKRCEPISEITDEIRELVEDMKETMLDADGGGLAAPQVGRDLRLFLTYPPMLQEDGSWERAEIYVFINPVILAYSKEQVTMQEGCLSIPEVFVHVSRPELLKIEATDLNGNRYTKEIRDYEARVFLHENDHINGVLMTDRAEGGERTEIEPMLRKLKKMTRQERK